LHLVFVGACLQANRGVQQASPQANIRRQAGSYRGAASCLCRRQACKRIAAGNGHLLTQTFAGRPAPTGEGCLVFKSVSEIYAPISGTIVVINEKLDSNPEVINSDPYGQGWIAEIEIAGTALSETLLSAQDYQKLTA
jgi:hypothetical protein